MSFFSPRSRARLFVKDHMLKIIIMTPRLIILVLSFSSLISLVNIYKIRPNKRFRPRPEPNAFWPIHPFQFNKNFTILIYYNRLTFTLCRPSVLASAGLAEVDCHVLYSSLKISLFPNGSEITISRVPQGIS